MDKSNTKFDMDTASVQSGYYKDGALIKQDMRSGRQVQRRVTPNADESIKVKKIADMFNTPRITRR